jgi:ubiquinone/menaquinone biosynthesis C-methylase UbiE
VANFALVGDSEDLTAPDVPRVATRSEGVAALSRVRTDYSQTHREQQEHVPCPLCGTLDEERLVIEVQDTMFGQPGKYRLVECERCAMRYINPRPAGDALLRHYPADYLCYTNFDQEHWLLHWAFQRMQLGQAKRRVRQIERASGKIAAGTRVLDVGCGRGELLARLKQDRGCVCTGTDINPDVLQHVGKELDIPVLQGALDEIELPEESFDLVTMTEYLEHEPRPGMMIDHAARLLRPGGLLAIEVPDITGPPGRLFGHNWWQIDAPRHLMFFSPSTLTETLEHRGFEVLRVQRYGMLTSMGYSLLQAMGLHYFGSNKLAYLTLSAVLGLPFVPFLPLLPDFMMVVARRK